MSVLIAEKICKSFGAQVVLEDMSLVVQPQERVALLGINGCGKSTFAKILAGVEQADSGTVQVQKGASVVYLSQEPALDPEAKVRDVVAEGLGHWLALRKRYDELSEKLAEGSEGEALERLLEAQEGCAAELERHGGWDRMHQVERVMSHLGILEPDALCGRLSGGERRRVALAQLLLRQPDLAILDEPTNHLDVETIAWLEEELRDNYKGALLFITHDRYFLDCLAQRIVEIDRQVMHHYKGGWDAYLEAKAERAAHEARTEANRQNYLRRELDWLSRSPQARTTKQKARIKRIQGVVEQGGPTKHQEMAKLAVQDARTGRTILDIGDLRLQIGDRVLIDSLTLCLAKGDRIGVIGKNGTGKTSLLRAVMGELQPSAGHITLGETMKVGYFEQSRANLDPDKSIFENVIGNHGDVQVGKERITPHAYLQRFQFDRRRTRDKVSVLSGGERARVSLAKMLIDPVNLLMLDEPTNDLDVATLSALEEMLVESAATAIVVTHDRYFLDRIATRILAFEGKGRVGLYASAQQALEALQRGRSEERQQKAETSSVQAGKKGKAKEKKPGLTYGERMELERIEDKVGAAEEEVARLEEILADPDLYASRGAEVPERQAELAAAKEALATIEERWEYLMAKEEASLA